MMGKNHTIQTVRRPRRNALAAFAALAWFGVIGAPAWADAPDGTTFGGVSLGSPVQQSDLDLAGQRAWSWTQGATTRLLLEGDVQIRIGNYTFDADRAAVWIEDGPAGAGQKQVAIYFANVRQRGSAAVSGEGRRLLVTTTLARPAINLKTDLLRNEAPESDFLRAAESRLAAHIASLTGVAPPPPPQGAAPPASEPQRPDSPDAAPAAAPPGSPGYLSRAPIAPMAEPIAGELSVPPLTPGPIAPIGGATISPPERRVVSFSGVPQMLAAQPDGTQIGLIHGSGPEGNVVIQYGVPDDLDGGWKIMELRARSAVVFLRREPGASPLRYDTQDIDGVYLEGDVVASDGDYTLRGSRIYYDIATSRGVVVDGVFWTYDEQRGMPVYLRAEIIRQTAQSEWRAEGATLANVDFAEPHFSIGAESITIRRTPRDGGATVSASGLGIGAGGDGGGSGGGDGGGDDRVTIDATNVGFRTGSLALVGAPRLRGQMRNSPLRAVQFDSVDGDPAIRTRWDAAALLGLDLPAGNRFDLLLDGYFARGPAVGADLSWRSREIAGSLFAYFIYDNGSDHLSSGAEIDRSDDARGMIVADNVWRLNDLWSTFAELAYISDPAFVDAFFESEGENRREFISALRARRLDAHTAFNIGVRGTLNDFIANEYLLQSRGYQVQKLPEARYSVVGLDAFGGLLSYTSETSVSSMELQFHEPPLRESGFDTIRRARAGFGLLPSSRLSDVLRDAGYPESTINRFDTRHEIELPLRVGENRAINITPFGAARFTAYDDDFEDFSGRDDDDPYRLWFAGGVRAATSFVRVDSGAKSQLFDIERLRHIVEPSVTLWSAGSTLDQSRLPIFDDDVESIADGTVVRVGVRNTLQTMRGPAGRKRSVDLLTLNSDMVWSTAEVDEESPYGRFIEARPELSNLGRFIANDAVWHATDAVTIAGNWLFNTDEGETARTTIGAIVDHGDGFWSFVEYRDLDSIDATRLNFGAGYELTTKYALTGEFIYDFDDKRVQSFQARITRRFPQWTLETGLDFDDIADSIGIGIVLRPVGFGGERRSHRLTEFGAGVVDQGPYRPATTPGRFRSGPLADQD